MDNKEKKQMNQEYLPEEFRRLDVDNCGYRYSISNYGRVYDHHRECFVSQVLTGDPQYFYVNLTPEKPLTDSSKRILRRINNLIGKVWIDNPQPDEYDRVDHIDQNKFNNSLDNLRWTDRKGNSQNINRYDKEHTVFTDSGELLILYCKDKYKDNWLTVYGYLTGKMLQGLSQTEAEEMWLRSKEFGISANKTIETSEGRMYLLDFLKEYCNNIDTSTYYSLKRLGFTDYEISEGYKYKVNIKKNTLKEHVETDSMWFPSINNLCIYYGMNDESYKKRLAKGLSYTEAIERKTIPIYTIDDITGTLRQLSEHFNIKYSVVSDRVQNKGYSVEDALKTERKRLTHFYVNGERMRKKKFLEMLLPEWLSVKDFNSKQSKLKLDLQGALDYYNIDHTMYELIPDV